MNFLRFSDVNDFFDRAGTKNFKLADFEQLDDISCEEDVEFED